MPNTKEKLIGLIDDFTDPLSVRDIHKADFAEKFANHLIANGVTIQKWIPVTERLPESKTMILVYGGNDMIWVNGVKKPMPSVHTGYMRGLDEGWFTWDEEKYIANVTHWMPLPEPPKGGE